MNKLESLLDGVASLKGWSNPDSYTYQIRNPLMIKSFASPPKHDIDSQGVRLFTSWDAGYRACLFDLKKKVSGTSRAGLRPTDTIANLCRVYGLSERLAHQQVCKFIKRALKRDDITPETPLTFFQE